MSYEVRNQRFSKNNDNIFQFTRDCNWIAPECHDNICNTLYVIKTRGFSRKSILWHCVNIRNRFDPRDLQFDDGFIVAHKSTTLSKFCCPNLIGHPKRTMWLLLFLMHNISKNVQQFSNWSSYLKVYHTG